MLIKCPECELQLSDKALACPHCGFPIQKLQEAANSRKYQQRSNRRRRLPNGFGQITKVRNSRLRKPFRAMITVGINPENGRPICKLLKPVSYFETYNAAYEALIEYNKSKHDPANRTTGTITLSDLYDKWHNEISLDGRSNSYMKRVTAAWKYCEPLSNKKLSEISSKEIRDCIINANTSANFKTVIKEILGTMYDYAVSLEYIDKNYVKMFTLPRNINKEAVDSIQHHMSFTDDEIKTLWDISDANEYAAMILIQCYSGWRPSELIELTLTNINIENWSFVGGNKTAYGINRTVPIHTKIRQFVKKFYDEAKVQRREYLFDITYNSYYKRFKQVMNDLKLDENHRPHDPRKYFVSVAKKRGVDNYAIKRLVGHAIDDLTERVYTDRDFEWLRSEIEKI